MPDVAIIPSGGEDRWGTALPAGDPIIVRDVVTYPRRSDETDEGSVITGINAIFPAEAPALPDAIDSLLVGVDLNADGTLVPGTGKKYEVVGDPGEWSWLDGTSAGTEVALQRVRG